MGKEIEHKYLVISEDYKTYSFESHHIIQGYISRDVERTVRVRIYDEKGFITIKGKTEGDTRLEFEYEIPVQEAKELLNLCIGNRIEKKRWIVNYGGHCWEIDEFANRDFPTVAEIELPHSTYNYPLPSFIGEEVTGNPKFYNSNL
ncbi:MAG: CYTH domain-containing protein [Muribaculaceae bacterium]|nr:CYTH domain-containing protein [Muribaculaceae bacterium]